MQYLFGELQGSREHQPRKLLPVSAVLPLMLLAAMTPESASAQIDPGRQINPPFEIIYAGEQTASRESFQSFTRSVSERDLVDSMPRNSNAAPSSRQTGISPLPESTIAEIDTKTSRLVARSRDAWQRGLMDNASYAAWLDIAATAQLELAIQQDDSERVLRTLKQQAAIWTEAATRLAEFNQPGSQGWQADLLHAQAMSLRATLQYSAAAGHSVQDRDLQACNQLATEHLEQRRRDFHAGTGSAADLLSAAQLVDERLVLPDSENTGTHSSSTADIPVFQVKSTTALRQSLDEIHRPVFLATYPDAISFRDHAEDRSEILRASQLVGYLETSPDSRNPVPFLEQLDQNAETIMAVQFDRIQTGTATPGGLVRQWWLHESLASTVNAPDTTNQTFQESQTRRLAQIREAANSLRDHRGRNSADIAAAEVLWSVQQLKLRSQSDQPGNSVSSSSTHPGSTVIGFPSK